MAVFSYMATHAHTGAVTGTIAADTPRQARDQLRARGLSVQLVRERRASTTAAGRGAGMAWRWASRGRRHRHHTQLLVRELATLLGVGVPLLEALDTLARQHTGAFLAIILLLRDRVAAGASLADAMREQPDVFDEICVNMVETGEDAGTLDATLERLAEFRERQAQLRGSLTTALLYPGVVSCMAVFVTIFLMTVVVPRIIEPLVEQGVELPALTVIVKAASDFVVRWWWALLTAAACVAIAAGLVLRTDGGRWAWHRAQLRLPLVGELVRKHAVVRIAVVVGTLLRSGIEFVRALQIAQRSTRNVVIRDALARCERAVSSGGDIAAGLQASGAFPPLVVQVFSVGQQSGRLEEMLDRLARDYDAQVALVAERVAAVLEPLLIVALAIVVLIILLATMLPILEAGHVLQ